MEHTMPNSKAARFCWVVMRDFWSRSSSRTWHCIWQATAALVRYL
jgi:hypothetical protein